ncbi:hypothetical protein [Borrelia sp. RT1S]|uniref:hypothetical protein n=1 Tax=Borrelia sp. RT1S TaxID=2898580 RepID=UPI001E2DE536|nr:hypothetical protein [Borrelia sp. RT1S]UGQ17946.1 hypothetical protein LSO05_05800 [Borrelia sp. RT1S]
MKKIIFLILIALFSCKALPESENKEKEDQTKKEMMKGDKDSDKKQSSKRTK